MTTSQTTPKSVVKTEKIFSQQVPSTGPQSMRPFTQDCLSDIRSRSHSFIVSQNKKSKTTAGEEPHFFIHLEDEGKTIFFRYYTEIKLPTESFQSLEPENLLTEEKLLEFSSNSIKSWVKSFLKTFSN
jgi:hypothetical protein